MKKISLGSMVFELLKSQAERPLTARQIAEQIFTVYPVCCQARKKAGSHLNTENDVMTQLVSEIGAHHPVLQK